MLQRRATTGGCPYNNAATFTTTLWSCPDEISGMCASSGKKIANDPLSVESQAVWFVREELHITFLIIFTGWLFAQ